MTAASLRLAGRILLIVLVIAGMASAFVWRDQLSPDALARNLADAPAAPLVYLLVHCVTSLLFIPRALIAAAAGIVFGLWWGLVWATIGSIIGSVLGFLIARHVNGGLVSLEKVPRAGPYIERAERGGWQAVALLRILPVMNHSFVNYALGLTKVPLGAFTLGSFLGQIPSTVAYVEFGAAGERAMSGQAGWIWPTLIGLAALGAAFVLQRWAQRRS